MRSRNSSTPMPSRFAFSRIRLASVLVGLVTAGQSTGSRSTMSKALREVGLDRRDYAGFGDRMTIRKSDRHGDEAKESLLRLPELRPFLVALDTRRRDLQIKTLEEFADRANHGVASWHAWNSGETSPKFLHLRDFANALGWDLGLLTQEGVVRPTGLAVLNPPDIGGTLARPSDGDKLADFVNGITDPGIRGRVVAAASLAAAEEY